MADFDYDLFTIGGGSGGVRASRVASQYGAKVALAEEYRMGGTCVIRGCVPKKLLVYASHFSEDFEDAAGYGWTVDGARFDWAKLIANKDKEIERLSQAYRRNLKSAGVEIFDTRAEVVGPHQIRLVKEGRTVSAQRILIATGGTPWFPNDVEGIEHAISSNDAFHLERMPKRVTIVGGGYIAVEFAGIFHGLGASVDLVHYGAQLLRSFDHDLGATLLQEMQKKGIAVRLNSFLQSIEKSAAGYRVTCRDGSELESDLVMFAVGRRPMTRGLGLEAVGVPLADNGAIIVDAYSRTKVPSIFAVGDVTDRLLLTPVAIREGQAFAETEFNNNPIAMTYENVATAIFSQPEIGTVGLSETLARRRHGAVDVYKTAFRPMKHTLSGRDQQTLMKIVVHPQTDKVLGVHVIGPDAGEMAQCVAIAVKMGATKRDFDATVAVHPTAAEELVTLRTKYRSEAEPDWERGRAQGN